MIKIEEGRFYRTRDGRKVGPMERRTDYDGCGELYLMCDWISPQFGYYQEDGTHGDGSSISAKLISEWPDEENGPIRTITRRELYAGQYGIVGVLEGCKVWIHAGLYTPDQLREAAHTLNQISEYLEKKEGE